MSIRLAYSVLIIGALTAVTVPQTLSMAQSSDQGASAPKSATPNMNTTPRKHRYWRHSGGRHPRQPAGSRPDVQGNGIAADQMSRLWGHCKRSRGCSSQ
jgi:hypothetical protein